MSERVRIECPLNPHCPQCFFLVLCAIYFARAAGRHRALHSRGNGFDVRHELRVKSNVQAVRACCGAGRGLTNDVTDSMVDWFARALFSTGRTLVSTNLAAFTVSLAATARACSMLVINVLMFSFSPFDAGRAVD